MVEGYPARVFVPGTVHVPVFKMLTRNLKPEENRHILVEHVAKVVPPLNFSMVDSGIYRSGYPNKKNHPFLQTLKLKSIMYLAPDDYSSENLEFIKANNITLFHYHINGNKEPFDEIAQTDIADALVQVLDSRNYPMLIHCNKGKHRLGCLIGCLRKMQNWSMTAIFDEYKRFSNKGRIMDQEFIEVFDAKVPIDPEHAPSWII